MQMQNVIIYDYFRIHFYILIDVRSKHSSCALGIFYSLFSSTASLFHAAAGFKMFMDVVECVWVGYWWLLKDFEAMHIFLKERRFFYSVQGNPRNTQVDLKVFIPRRRVLYKAAKCFWVLFKKFPSSIIQRRIY